MQFTVPKFIEKEAKIVGPFTFKQFIFVGIAGGICLFLYFTVSFGVFIVFSIFIIGIAFSLAFIKIEKTPLPIVIKNFFLFLTEPKIYLWKKKPIAPRIPPETQREKKQTLKREEEKLSLKITEKSKLRDLTTRLKIK